jgi:hypothetical protein
VFILGAQPAPVPPGGADVSCIASGLRPARHQGCASFGDVNRTSLRTSNLPETKFKFGFEARDGMAATWKLIYLVLSLSAVAALLLGLLALPVYPIVGALLTIAGMALQLYSVAGLNGAPLFKTESSEEDNWRKSRN